MVNLLKDWKKFYLIMFIIIFILSLLILLSSLNTYDIRTYVKENCINSDDLLKELTETNVKYEIENNNGVCEIRDYGIELIENGKE